MARRITGNVTVDMTQLMSAIGAVLDEYSTLAVDACSEAVNVVGKEGAKVTRKEGGYTDRRPKYRKSIRSKAVRRSSFEAKDLIYASGHEYSLTHLLENGHKLWQAPNRAKTRAFKHWVKGEDYVKEELPKELMKRLGGH